MSNLKNSLKSGGSGSVAIDHLSGFFDGLKSLMWALAAPIPLLSVILFIQAHYRKGCMIHLAFHASSLYCHNTHHNHFISHANVAGVALGALIVIFFADGRVHRIDETRG